MTQSYAQIQKQIAVLQRQADALRQKEVEEVVSRIKTAISHYGLTAQQLGFGAAPTRAISARRKALGSAAAREKYGDGNGNTWSGRGPRPRWLREALAAGQSLQDFLTGASAAGAPSAAAPAPKARGKGKAKTTQRQFKRRPSSVLYRDDAGHSWTGRGPQPRWLKEALASGRTLEDMKG